MNFRYLIEYQNKQARTLTVTYIPEDDRCLSVTIVIEYQASDSVEKIRARILTAAPIQQWEAVINNQDVEMTLGEFEAGKTDIEEASELINAPASFEDYKQNLYNQVDDWRVAAEGWGMEYTFPGDIVDVVQVRDERDLANINGRVSAAMILKAQGVTDPVLVFRAESNFTHNLTPDQMIDMGMAVGEFTANQYVIAWRIKEQILNATTVEELEAISWPVTN